MHSTAAKTLFAAATLAVSLAGCSGGRSGAGGPDSPEVTAGLRIEVRDSPAAAPRTATLACGSSLAGTGFLAGEAKARASCAAIFTDETRAALLEKPPPADRMCTMVFGGPQVARVTGTFRGRIVDRTFRRTNGCEIADWNMLVALLGEPRGDAGPPQ